MRMAFIQAENAQIFIGNSRTRFLLYFWCPPEILEKINNID